MMDGKLADVDIQCALDPQTCGDPEATEAILAVLPHPRRPEPLMHVLESAEAQLPYLALIVVAAIGWLAQKVLTPTIEEIGTYLRDALKAYIERRKNHPGAVQLILNLGELEFDISIRSDDLLQIADLRQEFASLREYLGSEIAGGTFQEGDRVSLWWSPERRQWCFVEVWPKDIGTRGGWLSYDAEKGEWQKKLLR